QRKRRETCCLSQLRHRTRNLQESTELAEASHRTVVHLLHPSPTNRRSHHQWHRRQLRTTIPTRRQRRQPKERSKRPWLDCYPHRYRRVRSVRQRHRNIANTTLRHTALPPQKTPGQRAHEKTNEKIS